MAAKKSNPAWELLLEFVKQNRKATYPEVVAVAAKKKLTIHPVMFGRAQAMLGIVKSAKRGTGKVASKSKEKAKGKGKTAAKTAQAVAPKASAIAAMPVKRGRGRPRKYPLVTPANTSIDGILAAVKAAEQARSRYRSALERIQAIVASALA